MPDVGVLQLSIQDNSKAAGQGLDFLAGALDRVKTAVDGAGTGLGLSSVSKELNKMAKSVMQAKSTITVLKTISDFGKSLSAISKIGTFEVNTESFNKLKDAVDGFKIGNAGSQLNQMRLALSGDWGGAGANTAAAKIDGIANAAQNLAAANAAVTIKNVAEAMKEFSNANAQLAESGGAHDLYSMMAGMSSQASGVGMNVAKGIEEGIESGKSGAVSASGDVSQEVIDKSKEVLDEHSPSEVFREIGENAMQGMINGMDGKRSDVVTTVTNIMQDAVNSATSNIPFFQALKGDWYYQFPQPSNDEQVEFVPGVNSFNSELMEADELLHNIETTAEEIQMPDFGDMQTESLDVSEWFDFPDAISESASAFTELATEIDPVTETIAGAGTVLKETADEMQTVSSEFTEVATELETAGDMYSALGDSVQQTQNVLSSVSESTQSAGAGMSELNSWMSKSSSVAGTLTGRLKDVDKEMRSKKTDANGAASGFSNFTKRLLEAFPALNAIRQRLKSVLTRQIATKILSGITSGFKEGIENLYNYSNAVGTSFAPAMDTAASSIKQLKNSLGAMAAPLIESLIPVFKSLIDVIISGVNWLNQLFSLLRGQSTWTRALPQTTTAFKDQTKAAKSASSAMKDLLADWDELNIIQSQGGNGGGAGAGTAAEDYANMFEQVSEYDERIKNIVDGINDRFGDIWGLVKRIGIAIGGWKLSKVFEGWLGTIGSLLGAALTLDIVFNLVNMFADNFLKTGDAGYLVGDLLTTLIGGYFTSKILKRVLGGRAATVAIPLTLLVSAFANATAVISSTDVDALSAESLTTSFISALEVGGAWAYLSYVSGGYSLGLSAGLGGSVALMTLGALIGLKATKDVIDTGEITKDTIVSDLLAAGAFGSGLFVAGLILKAGTVGTLMATGGVGAVAMLGALLLIQAVVKLAEDDEAITWGDKTASEQQIKDFVKNEMFSADVWANLTAYSKNVELGEGEDQKITDKVNAILPELYSLKVGIDTPGSIENIHSMIFDKDGLLDQYNNKYETSIATVKAAINLVPIKDDQGNDLSAEYFKGISSGWSQLNGVMKQLGEDLANEMVNANKSAMGSAARRMYENNVGILTQVMIDVNSAIASRHANSEAQQTFREGVENWDWDQKSYSELLKFYNEQKSDVDKQIEAAYKTYYDEVDDLITANETMLRDAKKYGLKEIGGRTTEELQAEIDELNKLRSILDENKKASIEAAKAYYESGSGYQLLHDAVLEHLNKKVTARDVEQMGDSRAAVNKNAVRDYFINGIGDFDTIATTLEGQLDILLKKKLGDSYETIKAMIDAGIFSYSEFVDETFYSAMAKRYGITGDYEKAWNEFIDQYLHPEALEELKENTPEPQYIEPPKVEVADADKVTEGIEENPAVKEAEETAEEIKHISEEATEAKKNIVALDEMQFDTKGVESSADTAASSIEEMARRIRDAFATLDGLSYEMDINGAKYSGAMSVLIPNIEQKASGGFVRSGDLVLANENGNFEMMGKMGNQPVVANNQQIVSGITQGVSQANTGVEQRLGAIETMLTRILQKEFVARAVPSSGWGQHGAQSTEAWNKVTG